MLQFKNKLFFKELNMDIKKIFSGRRPDEYINLIITSSILMVSLGIFIINYRPKLFNQLQNKAN